MTCYMAWMDAMLHLVTCRVPPCFLPSILVTDMASPHLSCLPCRILKAKDGGGRRREKREVRLVTPEEEAAGSVDIGRVVLPLPGAAFFYNLCKWSEEKTLTHSLGKPLCSLLYNRQTHGLTHQAPLFPPSTIHTGTSVQYPSHGTGELYKQVDTWKIVAPLALHPTGATVFFFTLVPTASIISIVARSISILSSIGW